MKYRLKLIYILFLGLSLSLFAREEKISLQLQWLDQFQFAGYYIAKEKGFYKDVNLDVDIKKFNNSVNIVDDVVSNKVQYGIGRSSLLVHKSNGKDIIALAAIFQSSPLILLSLKSPNIKNIQDFKNKKIMLTDHAIGITSLRAMIVSKNVSFDDMIVQKHSFDLNDLITKKTDVMTSYISNEPFRLKQKGIKYKIFSPTDYGFDFYSDYLFTSKKELNQHPKRVKRFLNASLKGWKYAFDHIEESVDIIYKKYNTQNKSKEALLYEAETLKELAFYKTQKIGTMIKKRLQRIYDIYVLMGLTNKKIDLNEFIYSSVKLNKKELAFIEETKTIKVHNEMNWAPHNFNENGIAKGYSIDYMNLIANKVGLSIQYISNKSWNDYMRMIKNKELDVMLNIVDLPKRREYINFTSSYSKVLPTIYTLKTAKNINSLKDLNGKTVSVPKGFYTYDLLTKYYPKINILTTNSILESLHNVAFKRVDAAISDFAVGNFLLEKDGISTVSARTNITDKRFQRKLKIGTRKDIPILRDILQKGMNTISDNELLELRRKWFGADMTPSKKKIPFTKVEKEFIQSKHKINICVDPDFAPYESIKDGKHLGLAADYMKYFSKVIHMDFKLVITSSWKQSLQFIKEKKCDILPAAAFTYERLKYLNFTKPYIFSPFVIATTHDKDFIRDIGQIITKRIGMVKGYSSIDIFKEKYPNINIVEYNSISKGLKAIQKKEIYGFVDTAETIGYYISKNKLQNLKIAGKLNESWEIGIGVRNDYPILLSILQKSISSLSKEDIDAINKKWMSIKFDKGLNYDVFLKVGIPIISILVIIIFYLWNIKLKQEIKNKRKLEKKLKASINDFKLLVNSTLEAIFIFEKNGYCIEANNAAIQLFKFGSPDSILGKHFLTLIDINSTVKLVQKLKKQEVEPFEASLMKNDHTFFPGLVKSINSTRGNKSIKIISIIDLSELKEKEGLLFQQSKLALMGEMMSAIAHQWRQPLNAIAAQNIKAEMILELNDKITTQQYIPISTGIENQLNYMSKTIDDFRDFFIPNKKKIDFSVTESIQNVYDLLIPQFKSNNIKVTLDCEDVMVSGFQNEFIQVIINIMNNAKDALVSKNNDADKNIIITVSALKEKKIQITISDNGGGIKEDIIEKIFDPYFTTKFKSQGTGIGLYMSKMIIEKSMGGKLSVQNSNDGAIFKILI
jgi:polar amino acid transport system substrate-binding protein